MVATETRGVDTGYELEHRYTRGQGRIFLTGIQALVRLPLMQRRLDRAMGLKTAGFISGYRGSPVAGLDQALADAAELLAAEDIRFQPGINEALAATAVLGSQQVETEEGRKVDGVFALWYGKGPGVDWAGDALKHGNAYGSSPHGGVLVVAGDDHGAVSSTMAHQSDQTLAAWSMPVLNPATIGEYLELGLYGWALSRFSGAWVGFKAISETVEGAATVELSGGLPVFVTPTDFEPPPGGLHYRWNDPPSVAIEARMLAKLAAAEAFARANPVDRLIVPAPRARLGIVTVGKAHGDLLEAFRLLGFPDARAIGELGIRVLKVAQTFPIEREGIRRFAKGLETLLVVEEKRPFVEDQIKTLLYPLPDAQRPRVLGKTDTDGKPLLPAAGELRAHRILPVLADLLREARPEIDLRARLRMLQPILPQPASATPVPAVRDPKRTPFYCSGCPHNTGTRLPEGSKALAGIGCHIMATWMPDRPTAGVAQMGGEGVTWTGLAPFTDTPHVFQNLGDGTYFHSGNLAIRQAVAANARITYKILFNDAVAMTGGQKMETAKLTVPQITRQVWDEGIRRIAVVSDQPEKYAEGIGLAPGTTVHHRRELDTVQRELRGYKGVSVLVYDQTCAAEKRRRRKRKEYPDPAKRAFINELVCEGCGDCSKVSNCLSIEPLETELGTKRKIDQSSCNKDYSCVEGFCPSFVTVEGGRLKRPAVPDMDDPEIARAFASLPMPVLPSAADGWDILVTGVGGTGVLTVGAVLGMAAHLEGRNVTVLDFTGLAQKGGAVLSHLRISDARPIAASRIEPGEAEAVIGCDLLVAAGSDARATVRKGVTRVVANAHTLPTADFVRNPEFRIDTRRLVSRLEATTGPGRVELIDAHRLALAVTGDAIGANILLTGFAWQKGLIPVSLDAIRRAIALNGVAVAANERAFAWGRMMAHDPGFVARVAGLEAPKGEPTLAEVIARRRAFLVAYQDERWAERYEALVREVEAAERKATEGRSTALTLAVAKGLFKLMAYKDEYEVARLYTDGSFTRQLEGAFEGDYKLRLHLAPPLLARRDKATGRPRKMAFGPWMLTAMRGLAKLKRLRGTALDPFGWTKERRMERALIEEYHETVREVLGCLTAENHEIAVRLAELPSRQVKGFGPVKEHNVEAYERERAALLEELHTPHPQPLPLAAE